MTHLCLKAHGRAQVDTSDAEEILFIWLTLYFVGFSSAYFGEFILDALHLI